MMPTFLTIAKKEIMDNIRNLWIIVLTVIFAMLVLIVSYLGSMGQGWQNLETTITLMMIIVYFLVPIIGLILGYAAVNREVESGSMNSLLTFPVDRWEVIIGKFLGLGGILSFCIFIGFGFAGLIIGLNVPNVDYGSYLFFIFSTILLGLVYMSISMMFSAIFKNRSSSIVMAIFIWFFFAMIWNFIVIGLIFATGGSFSKVPGLVYGFQLLNPITSYQYLVFWNVVPTGQQIITSDLPSFYTTSVMILVLAIWIFTPLLLSILLFNRRDI